MRILLIHSDYLKYETKNKTPVAEKIDDAHKKGDFNESLVVFTSVEKEDEKNPDAIVKNMVKEVKKVYDDVKAENIVLYPYAHLSSSLGSPKFAIEILENAEKSLKEDGYNVYRVPFGWYKGFKLSCKGHPLSELSRTITSDMSDDEEEKKEGPKSEWFILSDGKTYDPENYEYDNTSQLETLVKNELGTAKSEECEPPHVKLMREKELCDYEAASDVGNLKWYPKGRLVRDLLSDYVYNLVVDQGAMPIETPIFYNLENDAIREHAAKFGERQYRTATKNPLMLRFACCFGAFRVLGDTYLTWKNLPAKVYELSTYSFRYEQKGEVVGLKRLRAFTMPDFHSVCLNDEHARQVFAKQVDMCSQTESDLEVHYEVAFRVTQKFFDDNEDWIKQVVRENIKKPVLLEIIPKMKHYWNAKVDFAAIDDLGRPIENPTVQMDIQSARRFGITYLDENEEQQYPTILHCSPTGSIERVICSLLEKTSTDKGKKPSLPLWLAPTQVRIIPVTDKHMEYAEEVYQKIRGLNVRVDIDDTQERLGKKIRNSGKEWVPYTIVVGDNEIENNSITVNRRLDDTKEEISIEDLVNEIHSKTEGMPFRQLPLPYHVSKRVKFD